MSDEKKITCEHEWDVVSPCPECGLDLVPYRRVIESATPDEDEEFVHYDGEPDW